MNPLCHRYERRSRASKERRRARESANAPGIVGRIAKMRTEREDNARRYTRGSDEGKRKKDKERRKRAREKKGKRGETEKWPGRTARRRPWLMIYIESYLHLNVFIFNARPRNGLSALGGFVSAPHLLRPLTNLSRAPVPLRFVSTRKPLRSLAPKGRQYERKLANVFRRLCDAFLRRISGGLRRMI